jgi:hypothetical protein
VPECVLSTVSAQRKVGYPAAMDCQTCNDLLAAYRLSVGLFKEAVGNIPCAGDSTLAVASANHLRLKCRQASDALMEHWREHHGKAAKSGL